MALEDYANSAYHGKPIFLLVFSYGATTDFTYTTHTQEVTWTPPGEVDARVFTPLPIEFDDVEVKGAPEDQEFEIKVPRTSGIAVLFTGYPPTQPISVVIYEGNVVESDDTAAEQAGEQFDFFYRGTVSESGRDGPVASLVAKPLTAALQRPGLTQFYQLNCQVALYGSKCRADRASKTTTGTVLSLTGNSVTLDTGWGLSGIDSSKYIGGELRWTSDYGEEVRRILRVTGDTIVVAGLLRDVEVSDEVDVVLGCGHNLDDCNTLHENGPNYRGHHAIPDDNPVGKNNHT